MTAADAVHWRGVNHLALVTTDMDATVRFWHEVIGATVRGTDGLDLGHVDDVYRVGETDVLVLRGGPHGEFDLPVVRSLIRIFAPRRGEIVVDTAALDLGPPRGAERGDRGTRPPRRRSRGGADGPPGPAGESSDPEPSPVDAPGDAPASPGAGSERG